MSDQAQNAPIVPNVPSAEAQADAPVSQETAQASAPTRLKAIIDGIEQEVNPEDLIKDYQKFKSADNRFQEAAKLRKQMEEVASQLQPTLEAIMALDKDPWAVHKLLGVNYDELATKYAYEKALQAHEAETMSPEERRIRQLEEKLSSYENEVKRRKEQEEAEMTKRQKQEQELLMTQAIQTIDTDIINAIKDTGVKASPRLVARMAEEMHNHLVATGELLSAKEALNNVRREVTHYSPDDLLALLSPEALEKLASHKIQKKLGKDLIPKNQVNETTQDELDRELMKFFKFKK